jgi:hypothetical protein
VSSAKKRGEMAKERTRSEAAQSGACALEKVWSARKRKGLPTPRPVSAAPFLQVPELSLVDILPELAVARSGRDWKDVLRVNFFALVLLSLIGHSY